VALTVLHEHRHPRTIRSRSTPAALAPHRPDPAHNALTNGLLAALPPAQWQAWQRFLESVELPLGLVLHESGQSLAHVYFPTTAIVSLLYVMEDGASSEIAMVGREGVVGVHVLMGGHSTTSRAVVQSPGWGFRLKAQMVKAEFEVMGPVMHLILRYTQALPSPRV
jgi:hypothetical protein